MALLSIGAFARQCRLSAKALRLYDELGLLKPVQTDPDTGYRWYAPEQLGLARLVAWLRRIGMPLAQIALVVGLPRAEAAGQVTAFWRRVQAEHAQRAQLVSALIEHLERGDPAMADITTPLRLHWATYCDQGLVREENQDSVWAGEGLLGVADGFGTAGDTELASAVALRSLASVTSAASPGALLDTLHSAAGQVAASVRAMGQAEDKPGTTLTALAWAGGELALIHVGDSRAYVLRAGQLLQLTHDDTYVQRLLDEGKLTEEEARSHPQRMTLIKALHANSTAVPQVSAHRVEAGDRYLLCTDGLHLPVTTSPGCSPTTPTSIPPPRNWVRSSIKPVRRTTSSAWWPTSSRHDQVPAATATVAAVENNSYQAHLQYVRESAWEALYSGFVPKGRLIEELQELVEYDEDCPVSPHEAERVVEQLWARRQAELATAGLWTPTDDQRLGDAFTDLRAAGFVARMRCGFDQSEAGDECARAATAGGEWGYVFFHEQDANRLARGSGEALFLGYDVLQPSPAEAGAARAYDFASQEEYGSARTNLGGLIVETLTAHGLRSMWDGSGATRIEVPDLDWRRPLPDEDEQ